MQKSIRDQLILPSVAIIKKKKKKKVNIGKDVRNWKIWHTVGASSKLVLAICLGKD